MFLRFSAIAVFILTLGAVLAGTLLLRPATVQAQADVPANDIAKRFIPAGPAHAVPLFQFVDEKGVPHDLKEYKGRYVLLNVWATWCAPCVQEMPSLNALQQSFDFRELNVVAVNEDRNGEVSARSFYTLHDLKRLPVFVDTSGQALSLLHLAGLPVTLLIDPKGMEIGRVEGGADWSSPESIAFLKSKMVNF
jgi:thiol-disulfide isomerase/thioredoxin